MNAYPRAALWLFLALMIGCAWAAEPAAPEKEKKPRITCPPAVEAKLNEFVNKVTEAKRQVWNLRMKKEIDDVAKVTGLDAGAKKALEEPAKTAVDQCLGEWSSKVGDSFRVFCNRQPDQALAMLDQLIQQAGYYANEETFLNGDGPAEQPAWMEGLKLTLTAPQLAAWNKALAERDRAVEAETADFLKTFVERTREQYAKSILPKTTQLKAVLALSAERAAKLDALAQTAVDKSLDAWHARALKLLRSMDDDHIRKIMKTRQFFIDTDAKDLPERQSVWTDGLAAFLSADEWKHWNAVQDDRKSRRIHAMGRMLVAVLDERVAFTDSQRQQLEPIAERLAKDSSLFAEDAPEFQQGLAPQTFYAAGAAATGQEMKPILDGVQWAHWQEVCMGNGAQTDPPAAGARAATPQTTDPGDLESSISDFLQEKIVSRQKRFLDPMILKAEDAARVAQLPPGAAAQLQIAARGAAEKALAAWKSNFEQMVRSQIGDATAQNVKQRLGSIQDFFYQENQGDRMFGGRQPIWDTAVRTALNDAQRAAWQKEVDERAAYREKSITLAILAEFDHRTPISAGQWDKLEALLEKTLKDYGPDMAQVFSSPWYQEFYSMFIPFTCAPEKDLKAILTPEQWDTWTASGEFMNSSNYSRNIKDMHAQRVKGTP